MKKHHNDGKQAFLVFAGLMTSLLVYVLDSTIVSTAMTAITGELGGTQLYSWPFTAYMLTSTIVMPVCGMLSDLRGHKRILLVGLGVFLAGSVLCGLSRDMVTLIAFRAVQGIGGGAICSSVFTAVADLFPPSKRGRYTGLVTSMYGVASIIGPMAGGFVTDLLGWRWVFLLNVPLGILAAALVMVGLPKVMPADEGRTAGRRADVFGIASLTAALVPLLLALSMVGTYFEWLSIQFIGLVVTSAVLFALFGHIEARADDPVVPLSYLRDRTVGLSLAMGFLNQALMFVVIMYLPYFVQAVIGASATTSGVVVTPMMLALLLASNVAGQLVSRTGKCRLLSMGSFVLTAVGMLLLSRMSRDVSCVTVSLYAALVGFAVGINMPISNVNAQNAVGRERIGRVTSLAMFAKNMGRTVGSAAFGAVLTGSMSQGLAGLDMSQLPSSVQALVGNPATLTSASAMDVLRAQVPAAYAQNLDEILRQANSILATSVTDVFAVAVIVAVVAALLMVFLGEASTSGGCERQRAQAVVSRSDVGTGEATMRR